MTAESKLAGGIGARRVIVSIELVVREFIQRWNHWFKRVYRKGSR